MRDPFERILLATEHTEFDVGAERVAIELARRRGQLLTAVMPVVSNPEYEVVAPELAEQEGREARRKLEDLHAKALGAGVAVDARIRRGEEPSREIIAEAQECSADLIVVRRRGHRGFLANLMVGELAVKVAMHAPCSVLLVPRASLMWKRGVLAAVDTSTAAAQVASIAARIAVGHAIPLLLVSIVEHDRADAWSKYEAALEQACQSAAQHGAAVETRIVAGRPHECIIELAGQTGSDLLVIGRHGEHSPLHRLLPGGTVHNVVGLAQCPVLVAFTS